MSGVLAALGMLGFLACSCSSGDNEPVKFAYLADTHIALGSHAVETLKQCVRDINKQDSIDFVILAGDITDFGTDEELALTKSILDSLVPRYYILAGNHDANWSESGCNTFLKTFGYEQFEFEKGGWRFLGCNSGPDMRMAPALVPQETMLWLKNLKPGKKSIFVNHYPMDTSVLNYFDVTRALKNADVRLAMGGHWHQNRVLNYQGINAILGRSSLVSPGRPTGYNIVRLKGDHITISERRVSDDSAEELAPWYDEVLLPAVDTVVYDEHGLPSDFPWMRYDVNEKYPQVKELWKFQDEYNIVAGSAVSGEKAFYTTASGYVRCISLNDGKILWTKKFPGKIYSTPAVSGNTLVVGCSDGKVYAMNTDNGDPVWDFTANKSVVACPAIREGVVYIGASDGCFRALDLEDGHALWTYEGVEGHIVSTPVVDDEQVVFGSWGRKLYSLDPKTGAEQWIWTVPRQSRMHSPAACVPIKTEGKIFVAVPDRMVYAVDAKTGELVFKVSGGRDAIGVSEDGKTIFSKTMFHKTYAINTDGPEKIWEVENGTGYEIGPTALAERNGILFIPTDKGNLVALDAEDGSYLWAHKLSIALINPLQIIEKDGELHVLTTAMDGTVALLSVPSI